jgi:hypothetical protein
MMSAQACWRAFLHVFVPLEHKQGAGRSKPSEWEGSFTPRAQAPASSLSSASSPPSTVGQSASYFASISPNIRATPRRASGCIVRKSMMSAQSCPFWSR